MNKLLFVGLGFYFNIEKHEKNKFLFVILGFLDVIYFNIEKYERY